MRESIAKKLFCGNINEEDLFPFPYIDEAQAQMGIELADAIDKYAQANIKSDKIDEESAIPPEIINDLAQMGLMGLAVPEELGGLGLNYTLYARVFSQICYWDPSIATTLGAHQSIGYRALLNEGNPEQKSKYLPLLASGQMIAAFCLTEPSSGSDAYSIKTTATENADGSFSITGQKIWITNGKLADFYTVFCKTQDKISAFIVEKSYPGISFGEKEKKLGIRGSETRAVFFDKVQVPKENLLGKLGDGFKICLNVLNSGRLSLGSGAIGGMKRILELVTDHALTRKQFNKTISEFGLIQDKITEISAMIYSTESLIYFVTGNIQLGMKDYALESAICKIYGSECMWKAADLGLQIAAGIGYMRDYPYERLLRDSRINLIFEGTNEILRVLVALTGFKIPGDNLQKLGKLADINEALNDPRKTLGMLGDFAFKRIETIISPRSMEKTHPQLKEQMDECVHLIKEFSVKVENVLLKEGKKIIDLEFIHKRCANMSIHLMVMISVISRTTALLHQEKISVELKELALKCAQVSFKNSKHEFMKNFKEMDKNSDNLIREISNQMCSLGSYPFDVLYG